MKRLACLIAMLSMVCLLTFVPIAGAQQDQGVVPVSIQDGYFDPADVTVASGTTVMWTNEGNQPHTVTSDDGLFDSGVLYPGDSYWVTLYGQGTTTYHCSPSMTGSVTVV
jgi:plastocyanin